MVAEWGLQLSVGMADCQDGWCMLVAEVRVEQVTPTELQRGRNRIYCDVPKPEKVP